MAEEQEPEQSVTSKADALALIEQAEAEAAEAEALAAAARARARAARLRREAQADAESTDDLDANAGEDAQGAVENLEANTGEEASAEIVQPTDPVSRLTRWRRRLPPLAATANVAAIILIISFAGAAVYMEWQNGDATRREQRAAKFAAGARQGVIDMISLDYHRAKEDVQRVIDNSTGEFRDDFQKRASDFATVVEQSKVVTEGKVNAAALESIDDHFASVLVSATSRVTNAAGAKEEPREWRLRVTVTEDGGQYKMSKVEFVP